MTPEEEEFHRRMREEGKRRQQRLDKHRRAFHALTTGTIDQWVQELNDLSGLTDCDIDTDAWDAMRLQVLVELEATQDRTPERARALWMAIGCHYWVQRGLAAVLEGEA